MGALCLVLVSLFSTMCPSSSAIILLEKVKASCFALSVFLVACDSQCSVDLSRCAIAWSVVCHCVISDQAHLFLSVDVIKDVSAMHVIREKTTIGCLHAVSTGTVVPAKSDSDIMVCLQSYRGLRIDRSLVY